MRPTINLDGRICPAVSTLAELFQGRRPRVPLLDRQAGYRRAPREPAAGVQARLF